MFAFLPLPTLGEGKKAREGPGRAEERRAEGRIKGNRGRSRRLEVKHF